MRGQRSLWPKKLNRHEHGSWWLLSCLFSETKCQTSLHLLSVAVLSVWHTVRIYFTYTAWSPWNYSTSSQAGTQNICQVSLLPHTSHIQHLGWHSGTPEKQLPWNNQKHLYIFPGHKGLIHNGYCIKTSLSIHREKVLTERQAEYSAFSSKGKSFQITEQTRKKCNSKTSGRRKRG